MLAIEHVPAVVCCRDVRRRDDPRTGRCWPARSAKATTSSCVSGDELRARLVRPREGVHADGALPSPRRRHRARVTITTARTLSSTSIEMWETTAAMSRRARRESRSSSRSCPRTTASPRANRADLDAHGVWAVNLMSSPGAGKTTLLRRTLAALGEELRVGVLEGDIATSLDADQLSGLGAAISLVNTSAGFGGECHLDAVMVRSGFEPAAARRHRPTAHRERRQPRVSRGVRCRRGRARRWSTP